jgi:PE family
MEVGMSSPWVIAAPEYVAAAASDLANIGSSLSTANVAALVPTSGVLAAGADEVSAMIAALFSSHAQAYQALSAQAASFHAQFVQLMNTGASQYALAEAANASPLLETVGQGAAGAVNSSVQALTGSPLVGGGASAAISGGSSGSSGVKVTPAASVPSGGVTALAGNGAASAPNFAATGGIGGSGFNGGLLPSSAAAVANPIAAGNGAAAGTGGSGGLLSSDAVVDTDGGTASPPVATPLLNTIGTNGLAAGSQSGSAGVSENSGNGGAGRLGAEASTIGGQEGSGGEARASGDASGVGGATGTIGELREGRASFDGTVSQGGDETGTGAAGVAAISS